MGRAAELGGGFPRSTATTRPQQHEHSKGHSESSATHHTGDTTAAGFAKAIITRKSVQLTTAQANGIKHLRRLVTFAPPVRASQGLRRRSRSVHAIPARFTPSRRRMPLPLP